MKAHEIPERHFFKLAGQHYLVLVDYFSKFFEVSNINRKGTEDTINALKQHFARHGIGRKLISDNGPSYASQRFTDFAKNILVGTHNIQSKVREIKWYG